MSNIHECRRGSLKGLDCIFKVANVRAGEIMGYSCALGCKDIYNLEPETNSDGSINYQPTNKHEPIRIGDAAVIWENLTQHQSGKNYDGRDFNAGVEFHPLYTISEHNFPTRTHLAIEDVGEVFGEENPALVNSGWSEQKFYGKSNVEYCKLGVYGRPNHKEGIIVHQALRSHIGVPGFINYTHRNPTITKTFFLESASIGDILIYTRATFSNKKVADRIAEAMILTKEGHFVNIWVLLNNNFVPASEVKKFMSEVSLETMTSIYKSKPDIYNLFCLYNNIDKIVLCKKTKENGKEFVETEKIGKQSIRFYKENILNWILNYPGLRKIHTGTHAKYNRDERYWFIVQLMKRALRIDKIMRNVELPSWLIQICKENNEPIVNVFGELKKFSELSEDMISNYMEAKYHYLDTDDPKNIIMNLYPGMLNIKKEMKDAGLDTNEIGYQGWGQFVQILKLGKRWSMLEIFNAWEHFVPSWINDDIQYFYNWLHDVASAPIEPIYTINQNELDQITKKLGKESIIASEASPLQEGSAEKNLGLGDLSQSRAFASNILDCCMNWDEWEKWEDWDPEKMPIQGWYDATARICSIRESNHETFWSTLAKISAKGGIFKDREMILKKLTSETTNEATHPDSDITVLDGVGQVGLDSSDRSDIKGYNYKTDEISNLNQGDELCLGEE
jgi:hypothetical protein